MSHVLRSALLLSCSLVLWGCSAQAPPLKPDELAATARAITDGKSYLNARSACQAWAERMKWDIFHGRFDRLETLCQAIESHRAERPELGAARAVLQLAQPRLPIDDINFENLRLRMVAQQGADRSQWARAISVLAGDDRYRMAMISKQPGNFRRGDWEGYQLRKELWELPDDHPAAPALRLYTRFSQNAGYDFKKVNQTLLTRYPTDPGALAATARAENRLDPYSLVTRRALNDAVKGYQQAPAPAAALWLTINDALLPGQAYELNGWNWDILKPQFESLLQAHPDDADLHRSFARWAWSAGDKQTAGAELTRLGWQFDAALWGDASVPELAGLESSRSQLPLLAVSGEGSQPRFDLPPQVTELVHLSKYDLLDAVAAELRRSHPEQLRLFYEAAQATPVKLLQAWHKARPGSHTAEVALALALTDAAWWARGDGYAADVNPLHWGKFNALIKEASDLARNAASAGLKDPNLLAVLVNLEMAGDGDSERAFRIVNESLSQSIARDESLGNFALLILPRWHGRPGDLPRFADRLKKRLGHDQAYAKLASTIRWTQTAPFSADAEVPLDWPRWKASYAAGRAAGVLSSNDIANYALACLVQGERAECGRAMDDMKEDWQDTFCVTPAEWRMRRLWSQKKVEHYTGTPSCQATNPGSCQPEDPRILSRWLDAVGTPGSEWPEDPEVRPAAPVRAAQPRWMSGSRIAAVPGTQFGFTLKFARPLPNVLTYDLEVDAPQLTDPDLAPWSHVKWGGLMDAGMQEVPVRFTLSERFMAVPGTWTLHVWTRGEDRKEIARHSFQLVAPRQATRPSPDIVAP